MDRRGLPLNALRIFEVVGKHLNFTAAANSLFVSQSAVSRHVLILEDLLGVKLFERKRQHLALTEAGRALLPVVSKSLDRMERTLNELIRDGATTQRQVLRLRLPPTFAHNLAVPLLNDFHRAYPNIVMEISSPYDVGMPIFNGDIAVVYSRPEVSDFIADFLWQVRLTPLCHPDVVSDQSCDDLAKFIETTSLIHVTYGSNSPHRLWERFVRQAEHPGLHVGRGMVFDTASLAAQYAKSGQGVALLDPLLFQQEISSGLLVQPFNAWLDDGYGYYLLTHSEDLQNPAIANFRSWIISRFAHRGQTTNATRFAPGHSIT